MTNKDLRRWYDLFNRKGFGNKLPGNIEICWHKPLESRNAAELNSYVDTGKPIIWINPLFRPAENYATLLLLHEMIHLFLKTKKFPKKIYRSHGKFFKKEQKRLERLGIVRYFW